jgi:hypothetical protein
MSNPTPQEIFDPTRGELKLAGPGQRTVKDAALLGSLAVHRSVNLAACWTITHRATGCALGYMDGEEVEVVATAAEIEREHPDAFAKLDRLRFGQASPWKRRPPAIKVLVQALEERGLR